jgi:Phosphatidylinositol-glycan biosynthesis class S protein
LALEYAEKAFFDDKMVSMLYFPDEHKYAIYTPLFGPLALPLLMALLRELQLLLKGWKAKRIKPEPETDVNPTKESDVVVVRETGGESKVVVVSETQTLTSE